MIDFYTAATPNGWKASVTLEELEVPYTVKRVRILDGEQRKSELDGRLADNEYLAGDFSIADIANWSWARTHAWSGLDVTDLPNLQRWLDAISARPACQRGIRIPEDVGSLLTADNSDKKRKICRRRTYDGGQVIGVESGAPP